MATLRPLHVATAAMRSHGACIIMLLVWVWLCAPATVVWPADDKPATTSPQRKFRPPIHRRQIQPPPRFPFTIDPETPLEELLPSPPDPREELAPWVLTELASVPEVSFQKLQEHGTMNQTAHMLAKINHLNDQGTDRFLYTLLEKRADLAGLPFVMGDACRMNKAMSGHFAGEVNAVNRAKESVKEPVDAPKVAASKAQRFWQALDAQMTPASVAALMQMLGPDDKEMRSGLVKHLASIEHREANRALARLAIYSVEEEVRTAALNALNKRPVEDFADLLSQGLRYPWPAVAKQAAEAISALSAKEQIGDLVALLDEPDPRAPARRSIQGRQTMAVREVVRINHLRNCMLCHPPANTPDVDMSRFGETPGIASGAVPSPGHALGASSFGYQRGTSPDIIVRADITYLRQDFSLLQKVKNAAPWPEMQRFDFLVRTREVTAKEMDAYKAWVTKQGPGYLSPNHQAVLSALRRLTGRDAGTTAIAWRKALDLR